MSDSKIKFLTYDLLDNYRLLDPKWLDRNLEGLSEDDVNDIFSKLREWYFNYQPQITAAAKTGNVLFNIAPKTFFRYPLADTPVFSLKSVLPFLPFSNRVVISDPLLDAFNMSLKNDLTIDLKSFKEKIKKVNEGMRILRPFVEENIVLFYDFFLILDKDFINNTNLPILQSLDSEESLNDLLKVYEQDKTLLPVMEANVVIRNADGSIKSSSPAKGVFSTARLKLLLRSYHVPEAIKGALTDLLKRRTKDNSFNGYNELIRTEIEPQLCKINLEADRIRSKNRNIVYQNIAISSFCCVGSLFFATLLNQPDPLNVLLEVGSLAGLFNINKFIDARINKKDELNKLKQDNFYLLWYTTNSSKQL
ncbi:MAG: hypothetical protein HY754_14285 [Nitrospirae bacterium]|nr:hypothetical protein [Nitrospirota bacterium]